MTMTKKYKILGKYIKDMSSETPDIETYVFVRDYISKYQLNIDINSKPLKNKMIEVNTILKFEDKQENKKKSYFEINYSTIVKINDEIIIEFLESNYKSKFSFEKIYLDKTYNHKLSHQNLELKFWIIRTSSPVVKGISISNLNNYPFPKPLISYINTLERFLM